MYTSLKIFWQWQQENWQGLFYKKIGKDLLIKSFNEFCSFPKNFYFFKKYFYHFKYYYKDIMPNITFILNYNIEKKILAKISWIFQNFFRRTSKQNFNGFLFTSWPKKCKGFFLQKILDFTRLFPKDFQTKFRGVSSLFFGIVRNSNSRINSGYF